MSSSEAERALVEACERFHLPGLSVTVAVSDRPAATAVCGFADRRRETPVVAGTRFRIGSVSKALTSIALAHLVAEEIVDLDTPIQHYVPGFADKSVTPMTIRHIASHTSGLPHYRTKDFLNRRHYESLPQTLEKFADRPLLFEPGQGFSYSSFGWNLLGVVLEAASGMPFDELMNGLVFSPLGMTDTAVESSRPLAGQARPYVRLGRIILPAPRIDPSDAIPSAGFVSTTADLVRAGHAMATYEGMSPTEVALLWTETVTPDGKPTGYGLGWHRLEVAGSNGWGHGGSHVGATALLAVLPDLEVAVAVATNTNSPAGALTSCAERMVRVFQAA